jgi:predicted enzyme related to lactoylglutathione lyase
MTRRFPHGVPSWIDRSDLAARGFYADVLGWSFDDDGVARFDGRAVAGIGDPLAPPAWTTYVGVDDLAAKLAAVDEHGGRVLSREPDRALVADPSGATLVLAVEPREAELVNAPGTWNWSTLTTPDPARAATFYEAVLGWRFADPGFGALMVQRPGYGDVLAERDPSLRERHADPSVPAGFSDAIGWLAEGPAAQWTVTFAVADTDATVERARAAGARITSEPQTLGPTRVAELTDPQGSAITVSTYSP